MTRRGRRMTNSWRRFSLPEPLGRKPRSGRSWRALPPCRTTRRRLPPHPAGLPRPHRPVPDRRPEARADKGMRPIGLSPAQRFAGWRRKLEPHHACRRPRVLIMWPVSSNPPSALSRRIRRFSCFSSAERRPISIDRDDHPARSANRKAVMSRARPVASSACVAGSSGASRPT